tara:strand:+ start:41 stop:370 length:330 start_codon:yes stop_codon:yes gene_type:complete
MKVFFILVFIWHTPELNDWGMRQYARGDIEEPVEDDLSIFNTRKECEMFLVDEVWAHFGKPINIETYKAKLLNDANGERYITIVSGATNKPHTDVIYKCLEVHDPDEVN